MESRLWVQRYERAANYKLFRGIGRRLGSIVSAGKRTMQKVRHGTEQVGRALDRPFMVLTDPIGSASMQPLEPRLLLSVAGIAPAGYSLHDAGGGAGNVAVTVLGDNTTAGITLDVTTVDGVGEGVADTLTALNVNLPADATADTYTVEVFTTGIAGSAPSLSFTNMDAGDVIDLEYFVDTANDDSANGVFDPVGAGSAIEALVAGYVVDDTYDDSFDPAAADLAVPSAAAGDLGDITFPAALGGGTIEIDIDSTLADSAIGAVNLTGANLTADLDMSVAAGTDADTATFSGFADSASLTLGAFDASFAAEADGGVGTWTFGAINVDDSGSFATLTLANSPGPNVATGLVTLSGDGDVTVTTGATAVAMGSTTFGGLTFAATAGDADVEVLADPFVLSMGGVITGAVTSDPAASTDSSVFVASGTAELSSFSLDSFSSDNTSVVVLAAGISGSVTTGTITLGATAGDNEASLEVIVADGIGGVSLGDITLGDTASADTSAVNIIANTTAGGGGVLSFGDVTLNSTDNAGSVQVLADSFDSISVSSTWDFIGAGDVAILADTIGTIGGADWDVNFHDDTSGTLAIIVADGTGAITFNSIDFFDDDDGGITIVANADGDDDGAIAGNFLVEEGGDTNISFNSSSQIITDQLGDLTVPGTFNGSVIVVAANDEDDNTLGDVLIGQQADLTVVAGSNFFGTLVVDDGIGSLTMVGSGVISGATVIANADAGDEDGDLGAGFASTGSLGPVDIAGGGLGVDSVDGIEFIAADFDTFVVQTGNWNDSDILSNIDDPEDRIAAVSDVTSIAVQNGAMTGDNDFIVDDGIGAITVAAATPQFGDLNIDDLVTDADGGLDDGASLDADSNGGGFGGATATGDLVIDNLDTNGRDDLGMDTATANRDVGNIQGGNLVDIDAVNIGGSWTGVTIVKTAGADAANTIRIGDDLDTIVDGDLDNVSSPGEGDGDDVTFSGNTRVRGDVDTVSAGLDNLTSVSGLDVDGGTVGSPIAVFTDSGTDFILAVDGTFTGGSLAYTAVFPAAGDNTLSIDDIEGTTSPADSQLALATRAAGTAHTESDDDLTEWDIVGFVDDIGGLETGQHDWNQITIEGDVLTGDWGADSNNLDGSASDEPMLGDIVGIEIQDLWANSAVQIFALSIGEISFSSIDTDRVAATAGSQFSFDNPSGVQGDGVLPSGGNTNGTVEDLEIYTAFTPLDALDVIVSIPDGGSIIKIFVGPTGALETILFTDTEADGVINTIVLDFVGGMITDVHMFGENIAIEFQTVDPANPATDGSTNFFYGVDQAGVAATSTSDDEAIAFLEFSSGIGNVATTDIDAADGNTAGVGDVLVGFAGALDGLIVGDDGDSVLSEAELRQFINDPNDGTGGSGSVVTLEGTGAVAFAGAGDFDIDGFLGGVVTTGGAGTITTTDTDATDDGGDNIADASFLGLVTDGSAGAINIDGSVLTSLVVGDQILTDTGADTAAGGGDDTIDVNGTPTFGGDIDVNGDLGTIAGDVGASATPAASSGDEVSAPDGIDVPITVAESLHAAVISGKRVLVDADEDQSDDDITGDITASTIGGDIWSGDDISGAITATGLGLSTAAPGLIGDIAGDAVNDQLEIIATGAENGTTGAETAGDITGDITAAQDIWNVTISAGIGHGGSFLANITAGSDGTGSIDYDKDGILQADDLLGASPSGNYVTAGQDNFWEYVGSGRQTVAIEEVVVDGVTTAVTDPNPIDGGDMSLDFMAGGALADSLPFTGNINNDSLIMFENEHDSIGIEFLDVGGTTDGDADGDAMNELDSDLNGTFIAAADVTLGGVLVDGDAIGNDGDPGGIIAAAGSGYKDASMSRPNLLEVGADSPSVISGTLFGTFVAGKFVPFDHDGDNPLNSADAGPLQAGTVLTLGEVSIGPDGAEGSGALTVGAWDQSDTGTNGSDGLNLAELNSGTESSANVSYRPNFSIGATHDIEVNIDVVGLPGDGNTSPDPASGDGVDISIAAFGGVDGEIEFSDSGDINLVLSNMDAITAIGADGGEGEATDPSDPSTTLALNSGGESDDIDDDLSLDIVAYGSGTGGLDVEYFLAGFDLFVDIDTGLVDPNDAPLSTNAPADSIATAPKVPNFWAAFGTGDINGALVALDADSTNGLEVGDLSFALVAAGNDISVVMQASDDIIARTGAANKDGTALIPGGQDADVLAGASINSSINPMGTDSSPPFGTYFLGGGSLDGTVYAGDDIGSADADGLISIAAQGGESMFGNDTGAIDLELIAGITAQLAGTGLFDAFAGFVGTENEADGDSTTEGNIDAFIIAAGEVDGTIVTDGANLKLAGVFTGGIHAGAGADLDLFATADNDVDADMSADIYTSGDLNVEDAGGVTLGILAEDEIDGEIEVGSGIAGGSLLGNVVAEGDIDEIEVWGDVGRAGVDSVIYAGGEIGNFGVGDASGILSAGFADLRDTDLYIDTFGTVHADVFSGNEDGFVEDTQSFYIGDAFADGATLIAGLLQGYGSIALEQGGYRAQYDFGGADGGEGSGALVVQGGDVTSPDVFVYAWDTSETVDNGGTPIEVMVTGDGAEAGINHLVAVDGLNSLHVVDGSVAQITVNDDYDITSDLDAALATFDVSLDTFPFLTNSLDSVRGIEHAVNNNKQVIDANVINVDSNIGELGVSIGVGFNVAMDNAAVFIQGELGTSITSETGSIGNILIGGEIDDNTTLIHAQQDIGDVYITEGGINLDNDFQADEGSIGVIRAANDITVHSTTEGNSNNNLRIHGSIGGLTAVHGDLTASSGDAVEVLGSIGPLEASGNIAGTFTAETGAIGAVTSLAGDIGSPGSPLTLAANGGVSVDPFSLEFTHTVNGDVLDGIGSITAEIGSIWADITTGGSVGVVDTPGSASQVTGGIAAPIGSVNATLAVGGHVGGISGQSVSWNGTVLGSIGIIRNVSAGSATVEGVDFDNPLIVIAGNVDYRVVVDSGTASVSYTVSGGGVTFDNIDYTPGADGGEGGASGLTVATTTGGRNSGGTFEDSPVQAAVTNIDVHGDLDALVIEGVLGEVWVDGDINAGATILVEDGQWDSLEAGGVNNGLSTVTLSKTSKVASFANTLNDDADATGDEVISMYLKSGTADVTINHGYIERIELLGGKGRDLAVLNNAGGLNESQFVDALKAIRKGEANELLDSGPDVANVGTITGDGTKATKLSGVYIEGDVKSIDGATNKSRIKKVIVTGDATNILASKGVSKIDIRGDAGIIDGGTKTTSVTVGGSVDIIKATKKISKIVVGGNAGILSSGRTMSKVFVGGSSLSVGAAKMRSVQITGSVGASVDGALGIGLGSAFSIDDLVNLLGVNTNMLYDLGDPGPAAGNGSDHVFFGGLQAHSVKSVSVGGAISDMIITGRGGARAGSLFNSTIDDAHIMFWTRKNSFVKIDGEITVLPVSTEIGFGLV